MAEILIVLAFALLGIITQRIIGFGTALFLTPVSLIYFSPPVAVVITLFAGGVSSLVLLYMDRAKLELSKSIVLRVFFTALPGLLLGSYIVTQISRAWLQIIVGVLVILTILVQEHAFPKPTKNLEGATKSLTPAGFLAGVLNAAAAMAPIPLVIWMRTHKATPNQIRHNLSAIYILINTCSMTAIYFLKPQSFDTEVLGMCALILPIIIIGNIIGSYINTHIGYGLYHRIIYWAIIVAGLGSVIFGVVNLG